MAQEFAVGVDDAGVALLAGCPLLSLNLNACQKCAAAAAGPPCHYMRSHTCKFLCCGTCLVKKFLDCRNILKVETKQPRVTASFQVDA